MSGLYFFNLGYFSIFRDVQHHSAASCVVKTEKSEIHSFIRNGLSCAVHRAKAELQYSEKDSRA